MSTRNRHIFIHRFSSGQSCKVEILPYIHDGQLSIVTQDGHNELERWYDKDDKPLPDIGDFLGGRTEELPERQDIFHEYRDWFVREIIPAITNECNINVTTHIIGWRPHQQEIWDCAPGQLPVERHIAVDPVTGAITRSNAHDQR
jgi:hypothetical protein